MFLFDSSMRDTKRLVKSKKKKERKKERSRRRIIGKEKAKTEELHQISQVFILFVAGVVFSKTRPPGLNKTFCLSSSTSMQLSLGQAHKARSLHGEDSACDP